MTYYNLQRPAIAMIELIFAIVVMGIAMLSIPPMLESASKSSSVAFQQESIAIIASHANSMMTYAWDENNTETNAPNEILIVNNGDSEIDGNSTLNQANQIRVPGTLSASPSSLFGFKKDLDTTIGVETLKDDIDDWHNVDTNLTLQYSEYQLSTQGNYMDIDIAMHTEVNYLDDNANYNACRTSNGCAFSKNRTDWVSATDTTNIKLITTTLNSSNVSNKQIVLRSFMCNIGAARPRTKGSF